jgi:hypothetical protein
LRRIENLDSLPHNGAVVTLLAVCGSTHRESYLDIVMVAIVSAIIALASGDRARLGVRIVLRYRGLLRHGVLVDRAVLHDHQKILVRVLDELDIFQRIAVDQQQVGGRAAPPCESTVRDGTRGK